MTRAAPSRAACSTPRATVEGASVRALTAGENPIEISALVEQDQLRRFSGRTAARGRATRRVRRRSAVLPRGELGVIVGPIPPIPPPGATSRRPRRSSIRGAALLVGEPPPLAIDPARASIWTTGPDGRYRIRGLAKGKLAVLAVAGGYAEARSREVSSARAVRQRRRHLLTAGTYVVRQGHRPARRPVDRRAGHARKPEVGAPLDAFTDEAGMYRLGPLTGKVELVASAYGHVDAVARSSSRRRRARPPPSNARTSRSTSPMRCSRGRSTTPAGAAVAGARHRDHRGSAEGRARSSARTARSRSTAAGGQAARPRDASRLSDDGARASSRHDRPAQRLRLPSAVGRRRRCSTSRRRADRRHAVDAARPRRLTAEATTDKAGRVEARSARPGVEDRGEAPRVSCPHRARVDVKAGVRRA